jgi:hemerythrin-like metal-binding protein
VTRQWKASCCSLDPQLDEDHRSLFRLLDRIATHRRESDLEGINLLLDELLEYTFDHFAREERTMATWGFPKMAQHSNEHLAMRKAFIEALRQVTKGNLGLPVFIQHVKESFTYHFEMEDMVFVCWQQQQAQRLTDATEPVARPREHLPAERG